jgi:hypothetical protein
MATVTAPNDEAASGLKALISHPIDDKDAVFASATATITVIDPNATNASQLLAKAALGDAFTDLASAPAKLLLPAAAEAADEKLEKLKAVKADAKPQPQPAEQLGGDIEAKASKVR